MSSLAVGVSICSVSDFSYSTYYHNTQIFKLLQARVALLVATEGEKRNTFNHSNFNYF